MSSSSAAAIASDASSESENTRVAQMCAHCGQPVPRDSASTFCCTGCEVVAGLLREWGLARFYDLRPRTILPARESALRVTMPWLDALLAARPGTIELAIDGLQCLACVWVIRTLATRNGANASVDSLSGRLTLQYDPRNFLVREFLTRLTQLGYRTSPPRANPDSRVDRDLVLRLGVCAAIAMNTMFLAISVYVGLGARDPEIFRLFCGLNAVLSLVSVSVGGSYFFRRAWQGIRAGVLHFDVPIAVGILAAFAGSVYAEWRGHAEGAYFDTVNIFIALMLAGRVVQSGFMARNRRQDGLVPQISELTVLRVGRASALGSSVLEVTREAHTSAHINTNTENSVEEIRVDAVRAGDHLVIASGGVVPTQARLMSVSPAEADLSWISGEALPITYQVGDILPAGAQIISAHAVTVAALADFDHSALAALAPIAREQELLPNVWQWITKWYVLFVLTAATLGAWLWRAHGVTQALAVAVSILVITCPCSLGVAIPLARSFANRALIARGVFARDGRLLDKLTRVREIIFDKTGTLTFATLRIADPTLITQWSRATQTAIFNIVARSHHPASQALYQALLPLRLAWRDEIVTEELPGRGVRAKIDGAEWRVGRPSAGDRDARDDECATPSSNTLQCEHAASSHVTAQHGDASASYRVAIFHDEMLIATLALVEAPLEDIASVVAWCAAHGQSTHLLSGDRAPRVRAFAASAGIAPLRVRGGMQPQEKAAYLRTLDPHHTLMLGDGLNDAPACALAHVCGSPLHDRAAMATHADFYFIARSLRWLPEMFRIAHVQRRVLRTNALFALIYNSCGIAAGMLGFVTPLVCAIAMPIASLAILSLTIRRMRSVL